jgi:hypothetical protein
VGRVNPRDLSPGRAEILIAVAAFAVLCVVALSVRTLFLEPDDNAYQASIMAMTQGRFLTLSTLWGSRTRPPVLTWASTLPARIR